MRQRSMVFSFLICLLITVPLFSLTAEVNDQSKIDTVSLHKRHINFTIIDSLDQIIAKDASNHKLINQRGECWFALQKYKKALEDFQLAVKLETMDPHYNKNRGDAYLALRKEHKALESYNRAIRLDKKNLVGYIGKVELLLKQKKFDNAKKILKKAFSIEKNNPELLVLEGRLLAATGDLDNSYILYKKALTLSPKCRNARLHLAQFYIQNEELHKALPHVEAMLADDYYDMGARKALISICVKQNEMSTALNECDRLLSFDSTNAYLWSHRARCYLWFRQMHECSSDLKKAVELDSTNIEALFLQADYFRYDNKLSDAIRCYNKLIPMFPKDDSLYYYRADCRHSLGDFYNASKDYDKAISLNNKSPRYYNNSGANFSHMGWHKDAIKQYQVVLWLDTNATHVYCNIGTEYFHAQDYEKAEFYLKKFLKLVDGETDIVFLDLAQTMMEKIEKKKQEHKK